MTIGKKKLSIRKKKVSNGRNKTANKVAIGKNKINRGSNKIFQDKIKGLRPSLREKKRYVVFSIVEDKKQIKNDKSINLDANECEDFIKEVIRNYIGIKGLSEVGFIFLKKDYQSSNKKGIFRISVKKLNDVKEAMLFVKNYKNIKIRLDCLFVSGILKKARHKLNES